MPQGQGAAGEARTSAQEERRDPSPAALRLQGAALGPLPPPRDLEGGQEADGSAHPGPGRGAEPGRAGGPGAGEEEPGRGIILELRAAIT